MTDAPHDEPAPEETFWAVVIGSGFGGAVTSCRLAQALAPGGGPASPADVCLLERGRRFEPQDFPRLKLPRGLAWDADVMTSKRAPDATYLLWQLDQGLIDVANLGDLQVIQAAGLGGGSLMYANVHLRAPGEVFDTGDWPAGYTRQALDPYYDRAAAWLQAAPLPPTHRTLWKKTVQMERVAEALGGAKAGVNLFYPPLALTYGVGETTNPFNRTQRGCTGCGNCMLGCSETAKNTLDLNYLAVAEDLGVQIRTMAEVETIESHGRNNGKSNGKNDGSKGALVVRYLDHLRGRSPVAIRAEHVFVCAGAVSSTTLLLRSRAHEVLAPDRKGEGNGLDQLGERFFANGDNLGVIFDARESVEVTSGPTITTSMVHREPAPEKEEGMHLAEWFLLQDGGMPPGFERMLGFFRSAMWAERNLVQAAESLDDGSETRKSGGDQARRQAAQFVEDACRVGDYLLGRALSDEGWTRFLPEPLRKPAQQILGSSSRNRGWLEAITRSVRSRYWFGRLLPLESLLRNVVLSINSLHPRLRGLVWDKGGLHFLLEMVSLLLLDQRPSDRTAVFLGMGPDQPGTLTWDRNRTRATLDKTKTLRSFALQEHLMRDIATAMGGELRSNPRWTLGRRPTTVHAQGGCGMSEQPGQGVTAPSGRVWGFDRLYVQDGAVFPASVGVNPSATIAAVAERNVQAFLHEKLGLENQELEKRFRRGAGGAVIELAADPATAAHLPAALQQTRPITAKPARLVWKERMVGWYSDSPECGEKQFEMSPHPRARPSLRKLRDLERVGQNTGHKIDARLDVAIRDIEMFLLAAEHGRNEYSVPPAIVTGTVSLSGTIHDVSEGYLFFLFERVKGDGPAPRVLSGLGYELTLVHEGTTRVLQGRKFFEDDVGPDLWPDLSTLFFILGPPPGSDGEKGPPLYSGGILRVPLDQVITMQLPSFNVLTEGGQSEPLRAWAMARFASMFYGGIRNVYGLV